MFFFSSRRRQTSSSLVSGGRRWVKETAIRVSKASLSPLITLNTPFGNPASERSSANLIEQEGSFSEGFKTTVFPAAIAEITGVNAIKIKNLKTNEITELKVDGLFVAIGHDPATALFKDQLNMDKEGYLITKPDSTETNIPGVFAAGDVKDKIFRQAVTAAGMGCMSALEAEKHLSQ